MMDWKVQGANGTKNFKSSAQLTNRHVRQQGMSYYIASHIHTVCMQVIGARIEYWKQRDLSVVLAARKTI